MRVHPTGSRGVRGLLLFPVVLATALAACGGAASAPLDAVGNTVDGAYRSTAGGPADGAALPILSGTSDQSTQLYDVARPDLLIIKTGDLSLQVEALDAALTSASAKIGALGGYVAGSARKGDAQEATATIVYRIPAAKWDEAISALRGLAVKVLSEGTQTQDVTGQVLDLGAQITNLRASEAALQAIMARADKIADVLAVQAELSKTQGEIEQLSTQKKHLQEQAAFSTATVTFMLKPDAAVVTTTKGFDPTSEVDRASANLVAVLQGVATAGIWFGIVWLPILLVLSVVGLVAFVVIRRVRRTLVAPMPAMPALPPVGEAPAASEGPTAEA